MNLEGEKRKFNPKLMRPYGTKCYGHIHNLLLLSIIRQL